MFFSKEDKDNGRKHIIALILKKSEKFIKVILILMIYKEVDKNGTRRKKLCVQALWQRNNN